MTTCAFMSLGSSLAAYAEAPAADMPAVKPVPMPAVTLGALCQADAPAPILPASQALLQMAEDWGRDALSRGKQELPQPRAARMTHAFSTAQDLPWAAVLEEAAADLPAGLEDLPWLLILAEAETHLAGSASAISFGSLAGVAPQLEAVLLRQGQEARAALFRELQAVLPVPDRGGEARGEALAALYQTGEAFLQSPLYLAIDAYPQDDALRRAADQMAFRNPVLHEVLRARLASVSEEARLDWLLERLSHACAWRSWSSAEEGAAAFARLPEAPRQLLLLQEAASDFELDRVSDFLASSGAQMAPEVLAVLEARGLLPEAEALREGMALFPQPWSWEDDERRALMEADDSLWTRLDQIALPEGSVGRLRQEMLKISRDAGIMPRI